MGLVEPPTTTNDNDQFHSQLVFPFFLPYYETNLIMKLISICLIFSSIGLLFYILSPFQEKEI